MESANVHQQTKHDHPQDHLRRRHHHPHHQLVGSSSSSLAATTCYGVLGSSHPWTPNTILNSESFTSSYPNGGNTINSTPVEQNQNIIFPSWNIPMTTQEMGWANANPTGMRGTIKEEFSDNFHPKFQEILTSSQSSSSIEDHFRVNPSAYNKNYNDDLSAKLMLRTISCVNEDFTQNPSNMDMNLQALDLLTASKFNGDFVRNDNQLGLYRQAGLCYGLDHMQQSSQMPNNNKISGLNHGAAEAKRSTNTLEPKAPKKSRVEQRSSCPPFKVRKEKLGDRIAALQQLVAPFGKTDTASVLMEAIGYIKFLQSQVETLSVPYMKSSRNKTTGPTKLGVHESEDEETKRDLRSRGLCLVPLSSLSYMTDGGGGGAVWQPPHFGGST